MFALREYARHLKRSSPTPYIHMYPDSYISSLSCRPFIDGQTSQHERMKVLDNFKHNAAVSTIVISKVRPHSIHCCSRRNSSLPFTLLFPRSETTHLTSLMPTCSSRYLPMAGQEDKRLRDLGGSSEQREVSNDSVNKITNL